MIARRAMLSILNNVLGAVLGLVALNFLTAYGGKVPWGMWVYASALMGLAALPTGLGFVNAHVKRVSQGTPEAAANATFLWLKLALTGAFAVVTAGALFAWTRLLGRRVSDTTEAVLVLALLYMVIVSLRQFFDATFQAHRLVATYESVLLVDTLVTVASVMTATLSIARLRNAPVPFPSWADASIAFFGLDGPLGAADAALLLATAYVTGKAVSFVYAVIEFARHHHPVGKANWAIVRSYTRFAIPAAVVGVFATITNLIDRAFLGYFGTPELVAEYFLAYQLLSPMLIVSTALALLLFPTLSSLHRKTDAQTIQRLVADGERYLSMLLVPQVMLALVFSLEGIRVASSSTAYDDAVPVLRALTVYYLFLGLVVPTRSLLFGFDQPQTLARLGLLNAVLVVVLNLIAIPDDILGIPLLGLGALGAGLVAAFLGAFNYVYVHVKTRHWTNARPIPPESGRHWAAAALAGLTLWTLKTYAAPFDFDHVLELGLAGLVGILLYWVALMVFGGFTRRDADLLWDILNPKKLADYLGAEWSSRRPR